MARYIFALMAIFFGLTLTASTTHAATDTDNDLLPDAFEDLIGTSSTLANTDGDKFPDWHEVYRGHDPIIKNSKALKVSWFHLDTDKDGLTDLEEIHMGTNREVADSDDDGFSDGDETRWGYDPLSTSVTKLEKRIEVSIARQELKYFLGTYEINVFKISSGLPATPTPLGDFTVLKKFPKIDYVGAGYSYLGTKWNLRFKPGKTGNYYIHGAYWHDSFGKKRSHGCVNVAYPQVERLYGFADEGTKVIVR